MDRSIKVSILSAPTGGGHAGVARALKTALESLGAQVDVVTDAFAFGGKAFHNFGASYGPLVRRAPSLWGLGFRAANGRRRAALLNATTSLVINRGLGAYVEQAQPDILVSVHPFFVGSVANLRPILGDLPFGVFITDLVSINPLWVDARVDFIGCPLPETQEMCTQLGMPEHLLHVVGLPLRVEPTDTPANKALVRAELGWEDRPTIVVGGNGEGAGRVLRAIELLIEADKWQVVAVTGRNATLRDRLEHMAAGNPLLRVYGFVDFMDKILVAADLIVTKAGPTILMEAVSHGVPVIVTDFLPGQEEGNLGLVQRHRLGAIVRDLTILTETAEQWIGRSIRQQVAAIYQPGAAGRAADLILTRLATRCRTGRLPIGY